MTCILSKLMLHTMIYNLRIHVGHENMMSCVQTYVTYKMCNVRTYAANEYAIIFYPN